MTHKDQLEKAKNEFIQSQILFVLSNLAFCKKFDQYLLKFWRETNLIEKHMKVSEQNRNGDTQFLQALVHLISCMVESAANSDDKKKESKYEKKDDQEEEMKNTKNDDKD